MNSPVQEIKSKIDIVDFLKGYIELLPAGRNFKGRCPFHNEKTASMMISPDKQIWHCFGCNEGGDVFEFLMKYDHLEFYEALKILAEKAGVELKKTSPSEYKEFGILYDINRAAADFYMEKFKESELAKNYILNRGVTEESIKKFEIGFAPAEWDTLVLNLINKGFEVKDMERAGVAIKTQKGTYVDRFRGRIMFPLINSFGKAVGFSGRIMPEFDDGKSGKYVNSPETPIFSKSKILYGFHQAKESIRTRKEALLVEGQMDVIMCHQDGVENAVGTSGTALTDEALNILKRYTNKLVMNFDNDSAGKMAMERSIDMANSKDFEVYCLDFSNSEEIKDVKDPADIVASHKGLMGELVKKSIPAMEYYFKNYPVSHGDISVKKGNVRFILKKITLMPSAVERAHWFRELSFRAGVRDIDLAEEMKVLNISPQSKIKSTISSSVMQSQLSHKPKTHREIISVRILKIVVNWPELQSIVKNAIDYLPKSHLDIYNSIISSENNNPDLEDRITKFSMKAGVELGTISKESAEMELGELVRNLELEYLTEQKEALAKSMQSLSPDSKEADDILREMQEVIIKLENIKKNKNG